MTRSILTLSLAVTLTAALAATPARAEPTQRSVNHVYATVDCLLQRRSPDVRSVLSEIPGYNGLNQPIVPAATRHCVIEDHNLPASEFYNRGAIAERFLYRHFEAIGAPPRGDPLRVFAPVSAYYLQNAGGYGRNALAALDMAACVVRAEPQKAYAFFRTERYSEAERAAIAELMPAISGCVTEGQNVELSPPIFRAFLAEAAYRVAVGRPRVFAAD